MAVETAEPPVTEPIQNPVIKEDFQDAKAVFRKSMEDEGAAKPEPQKSVIETKVEPTPEPVKPSVLPADVIDPKKDEPAKPSEALAAIEAMELPKGATQKAVAGFAELKEKAKTQLSQAETKIKDLEDKLSKATSHVEIEALNAKLKTAEERASQIEEQWGKVAFKESPRFQAMFVKPEKDALDSAKSYLEGTEIDPRIIEIAAQNSGKKRLDILKEAGADPELIAAVSSHLATFDLIQKEKQSTLENWKQEGARWQEEEQRRVEAEMARRSEFETRVWEQVSSKNSTLLPFRTSKDETWNAQGDKFKADAREVFMGKGADPERMANVVQLGVVAESGFYDKIIEHLTSEVKLKDEQIAKLTSSRPGGIITTSNGSVTPQDTSKIGRDDLSKQTFNQELQKARGTP